MLDLPFGHRLNQLTHAYLSLDTSDPENYPTACNILDKYLQSIGLKTKKILMPEKVAGGPHRYNLIATRSTNSTAPTLVIYNHMDVVPANYPKAFAPHLKDNKLYARGAADHKGGTLAVLASLEALQLKKLAFNLIFVATTDEETGQSPQLDYLFNYLNLPRDALLFDTDTYAGGITIARLGRLNLKLRVYGEATHAGISHVGHNAIQDAIKLVQFINELKPAFEKQTSKIPPVPTAKVASVQNKLNVTMLNCGVAINVIPSSCDIGINVRFIPELDDFEEEDKLLEQLQQFCIKSKFDYDVVHSNLISGLPSNHPSCNHLKLCHQKVTGSSGLYAVPISNPMIDIARKYHFPLMGLGLMRHDTNIHADQEFCYVQDMFDLKQTLQLFLTT